MGRDYKGRRGYAFASKMVELVKLVNTTSSRRTKEAFDRHVFDLYQMVDTLEQETDWINADEPAPVAAESKPATETKKPVKKTQRAKKPSSPFGKET